MSRLQSIRLSLLAGSSLAALAFTPSAALAANECGNPNTNLGAADIFACPSPPTSYTSGILYTSNGDLTLNVGAGVVGFGTGGLVATAGNLNDDLTVTTTTTALSTSTATGTRAPVVIDLQSQSGDVTVQAAGTIGGAAAFVQYAIRGRSTGAGNVTVNSTAGNVQVGTGANDPGIAAIFASSNGGSIDIDKPSGNISGRTYGIQAHTSGAGTIDIDLAGTVSLASVAVPSVAAIEARSGTGAITIDATGNIGVGGTQNLQNNVAVGILTESGGGVTVKVRNLQGGATTQRRLQTWAMRSSGAGSVSLTIEGPAPTSTLNPLGVTAIMQGGVDFSGLGGASTINLTANSAWEVSRDSVFGGGNDTVNIAAGAYLHLLNFKQEDILGVTDDRYTLAFGGGDNRIVNNGAVMVGVDEDYIAGSRSGVDRYEGELRLTGLTTFQNNGVIFLGAYNFDPGSGQQRTLTSDGWHDDILAMPGADFVAGPDSRIVMDVFYNGVGQDQCDASLRNSVGDLPGADCIDLRGGSVTGQTLVSIHDEFSGERGAYNPGGTVIVDVGGGAASADAFVLAPDSTGYSAKAGGVIDKGLFTYALGYDDANQQFRIYGVASDVSQQYPLLAQAANDLWRTGTGGWFDHRRGSVIGGERDAGFGGGVWLHVTGADVERDVRNTVTAGTTVIDSDNSYSQRNTTVTAGADLLSGDGAAMSWGLGVMVGYNRGEVDFDQSLNTANLEGVHSGVYGGVTMGAFYLDAVLNSAWLTLDSDAPILNLFPAGTMASTTVVSLGAQAEAGWRFALGPAAITPLASVSYVSSTVEDLNVPSADPSRIGGDVVFEDARSLRAGLGARVSMTDVMSQVAPVSLSLTARAMQESEGMADADIHNVGPFAAPVSDVLDGMFSEVVGVVAITNQSRTAAGVLNLGGVFGDDYRSVSASVGLRYQW